MANENLRKLETEIYSCANCGQCVRGPVNPYLCLGNRGPDELYPYRECPMREYHMALTYTPAGMNLIGRALLEGNLEVDEELVTQVEQCVLCESCLSVCGEASKVLGEMTHIDIACDVNTPDVVRAMRADFVNLGKGPSDAIKRVTSLIEKSHNRFNRPQSARASWIQDNIQVSKNAKLLYFAGCTASYKNTEIAQKFAKILNKAGVEFAVLGEEEWCCGGPQLFNAGLVKQFEAQAKHNVEAIKASGATEVVATCADCYRTLKVDYPKVVKDLGFTVMHSSELLARLIDQKKIKLTKDMNETVTFHDPCQLARAGKVIDEPRKVIKSIPGIELKEMLGNKEFTQCCGRYPVELHEQSMHTGMDRMRDAQDTGATTLVTACSFCKWILGSAAKKLGSEIKVTDINELVAESMGL